MLEASYARAWACLNIIAHPLSRVGRILHLSPVKRIRSYCSLSHSAFACTLSNFFLFIFLYIDRSSTAFWREHTEDVTINCRVQELTQETDMEIKNSRCSRQKLQVIHLN